MKKFSRNEYTLSAPGGVFRVVQYFNAKGEEYLRQYYPISKKAVNQSNSSLRTKAFLVSNEVKGKEKEF